MRDDESALDSRPVGYVENVRIGCAVQKRANFLSIDMHIDRLCSGRMWSLST